MLSGSLKLHANGGCVPPRRARVKRVDVRKAVASGEYAWREKQLIGTKPKEYKAVQLWIDGRRWKKTPRRVMAYSQGHLVSTLLQKYFRAVFLGHIPLGQRYIITNIHEKQKTTWTNLKRQERRDY